MLETHPLVEPLRDQPPQEASEIGGVVEMERESVGVGATEEGSEERDRVWVTSGAPQAVQENRAVEVRPASIRQSMSQSIYLWGKSDRRKAVN